MESIKLAQLLTNLEAVRSQDCVPEIFGDAYLLKNNEIYRRVREFSLQMGCRYVEAESQYLVYPLFELKRIVSSKNIPFIAGHRLLLNIEARNPKMFTVDDVPLPESHHMHEAAHVIATYLFSKIEFEDANQKIFRDILCESFANTVDALACLPAARDTNHQMYLRPNCYMAPHDDDLALMLRLRGLVEPKCYFVLTLFSYVYSNFLLEVFVRPTITELVQKYAPNVKVDDDLLKLIEGLGHIGNQLDEQFRVQTTGLHLRLEGFTEELFELLNFDFMKTYSADHRFSEVVEAMAQILVG